MDELYADRDFYDDVSGMPLDKKLATQARNNEIDFFKDRGVYTKVRREPLMKVITTKLIDHNKGDEAAPNYLAVKCLTINGMIYTLPRLRWRA